MSQRYEGFIEGHQGLEIFYQGWRCAEPKGTLLITHGLAEHSECYDELARDLNISKWHVVGYDLRGHGRSEGQRGFVNDFKNFERDLSIVIDFVAANIHLNKGPLVVFGHSLGGLITTKTILNYDFPLVSGLALSSPAMGLSVTVPAWKHSASEWAHRVFPRLTMFNEIYMDQLIQDPRKQDAYKKDPLRHDKISPSLYLGMRAGFEDVYNRASEIKLPMILQIPRKDPVVSSDASIRFYDRVSSSKKTLRIYENSRHEVFNDLERLNAVEDLRSFLNAI